MLAGVAASASPRYRSMTSWPASDDGPDQPTRPRVKITQVSAIANARCTNCSLSTMVIPERRASSRPSKTDSATSGASPSDISSAMTSFGETASARASASICCSPPERLPARWKLR